MALFWNSFVLICLSGICILNAADLYPSYTATVEPEEVVEWSENQALSYITTIRLFDYNHYIFQYRRYPCQYYYTDEIQIFHSNDTLNQCFQNSTSKEYEYQFQLHLDSRHVEPYILRNIALQCDYVNCSFSLLNITYVYIGWTLYGRQNNPECSFDTQTPYYIYRTPYTISEWITLRCKSLSACNQSKTNLEQAFVPSIQLIYGSAYELDIPYCSLERNVRHLINKNFAETNGLLKKLIQLLQTRSEKSPITK